MFKYPAKISKWSFALIIYWLFFAVCHADNYGTYYLRNPSNLEKLNSGVKQKYLKFRNDNGKIVVNAISLPGVVAVDEKRISDYSLVSVESPDSHFQLLYIADHGSIVMGVWLLGQNGELRSVSTVPQGSHFFARWIDNEYFEIQWAGMGYATSSIFSAKAPAQHFEIDSLVAFIPKKNTYMYVSNESPEKKYGCYIFIGHLNDPSFSKVLDVGISYEYEDGCFSNFRTLEVDEANITAKYEDEKGRVHSKNFVINW